MNAAELRAILQSDFKLWEAAHTAVDFEGGAVIKTLDLPHGIGLFQLAFEGANDAKGRRNAAAIWGQSIRDAVDDAIGEEAVTARAAQAAAKAGPIDGEHGGPSEPSAYDAREAPVSEAQAVSPLGIPSTISTEPSIRVDELRGLRDKYADIIKGLDLEIKALAAYVEVMNAQAVPEETARDSTTENSE